MEDEVEYTYAEGPPGQDYVMQLPSGWCIPPDHRWWGMFVQPWLDAGNTLLPYPYPVIPGPMSVPGGTAEL